MDYMKNKLAPQLTDSIQEAMRIRDMAKRAAKSSCFSSGWAIYCKLRIYVQLNEIGKGEKLISQTLLGTQDNVFTARLQAVQFSLECLCCAKFKIYEKSDFYGTRTQ